MPEAEDLTAVLKVQLRREREVIAAMRRRQRKWHGPVLDLFWRKPWRSTAGVGVSRDRSVRVNLSNFLGWLRNAHDCADPSVGCSCSGGYRHP
jgi:hypothetical protein